MPRDLSSRLWADLFEYYADVTYRDGSDAEGDHVEVKITDMITPDTLREMDEREAANRLDDGTTIDDVCAILLRDPRADVPRRFPVRQSRPIADAEPRRSGESGVEP